MTPSNPKLPKLPVVTVSRSKALGRNKPQITTRLYFSKCARDLLQFMNRNKNYIKIQFLSDSNSIGFSLTNESSFLTVMEKRSAYYLTSKEAVNLISTHFIAKHAKKHTNYKYQLYIDPIVVNNETVYVFKMHTPPVTYQQDLKTRFLSVVSELEVILNQVYATGRHNEFEYTTEVKSMLSQVNPSTLIPETNSKFE